MENKNIIITIAGETGSGKSNLLFLLKKYLKDNGFNTVFDGGIDFQNEEIFDDHINMNIDKNIETIKNNRTIIFEEYQLIKKLK